MSRGSSGKFYENKLRTVNERRIYRASQGRGEGRYIPEGGLTYERCVEIFRSGQPHDPIELIRWTELNPEGTAELVASGKATWRALWNQGFRWQVQGDIHEVKTRRRLKQLIEDNPYEQYALAFRPAR